MPVPINTEMIFCVLLGEKLLPDGDFSGYVEKGNASTRRGFLFSNGLGKTESIT